MNLDDFKIEDMQYILNEDTTLARFYPLIPIKETMIECLVKNGIVLKSHYDELFSFDIEKLKEITGMEQGILRLFQGVLHLHDFKNRSLKELKSLNSNVLETVLSQGYKKSLDILLLASEKRRSAFGRLVSFDATSRGKGYPG